jgi:hypothetical protein
MIFALTLPSLPKPFLEAFVFAVRVKHTSDSIAESVNDKRVAGVYAIGIVLQRN